MSDDSQRPTKAPPARVSDAAPRLKARRRTAARRRIVVWTALASAVVLLISCVWMIGFSRVFDLRQVVVQGNELTSGAQIIGAADAPLGTAMARLDTGAIAQRVAEIPAVETATVSTRWPHAIVVHVTERVLAVQRPEGSQWQWVDPSGFIFHETAEPQEGITVVKTPSTENRLLADGVTVAGALTPELRERVQHIQVDAPDRITLVLDQGQSVVWGSVDDSVTKAQVATALLAVGKARVFDVSSPARPTSR